MEISKLMSVSEIKKEGDGKQGRVQRDEKPKGYWAGESYWVRGWLGGGGGGCGERPSGCVCKAKRPAVGAHLLTISPWRVA